MRVIAIYGRVLRLLRGHPWTVSLLSLANLALAGLQFLDPMLFGRVIEMLSNSGSMSDTQTLAMAVPILATWGAVGLFGIVANMLVALCADRLSHRRRREEVARFYSHILALPSSFHIGIHSGELTKVMWSGADTLFGLWLGFFREQLSTWVSICVLLPLTFILNWRLATALLVLAVVFSITTAVTITRTEAKQRKAQSYHNKLAAAASDALANVAVVQSFNRVDAERSRFGQVYDTMLSHQFPVLNWWAFVTVMTRTSSTVAVMSIVTIGTLLHARGQAGVGEIVSFMGFAGLLIGRLEALMWFVSRLFQTVPALEEYFSILAPASGVPERVDAKPLVLTKGEVAFHGVSFAYPSAPMTLTDVGFRAAPGSVTALVGQTGAGKTTTMALLQRVWDPVAGRITIDGQDTRNVTLESLRDSIGVVFQDSMLFARSIRDNLRVGKPDATDAEIVRACRLAEAHEFILRQPQGYDTIVGERGATLSGGQRQRLAIARALLKNPPILILDEATSALDAATEVKVSRALRALMAGRTTFIIAHRLSTVRDADEILVFNNGEITERGRFNDLVRLGGDFAALVEAQMTPQPLPIHSQFGEAEFGHLELADAA